ncbi:MaoC family dehydratase N-terminal domain-containing protein [Brevibacillus humidisoli]|uniref:MaoC family dehydratase N-terminal domain-containing protein n=1 Tax=Brevibacillus humidisoli TaxID=2895522 RepID=UPI001E36826A|nr:MaoC family dehydratase N-terminal domain-containing protein [Brevibacillus humidisoli]UFJ39499.1 MaoC family dehydratase N-terminal domain-containing protein [Brevibacillus humidisoli]
MTKDLSKYVGYTFEPYAYRVEAGKIREFALAIGDDNPIYHDRDVAQQSGFRDIPLPPTFSTVIEMWAGPSFEHLIEVLELDPLRVLHGKQRYDYGSVICAGDEITACSRIVAAESKSRMNLFTLVTEYANQQGEQVLRAESVIIEMQERMRAKEGKG